MIEYYKILILVVFITIALFFDLKEYRIPNLLNAVFLIAAISYNTIIQGIAGALVSLKGFFIGFLIIFILYIISAVAAGDVKLFSVLGALMGGEFVLYLTIVTVLLAGVFTIIFIAIKNKKTLISAESKFMGFQFLSSKLFNEILRGANNQTYFPLMVFVAPAVFIVLVMTS